MQNFKGRKEILDAFPFAGAFILQIIQDPTVKNTEQRWIWACSWASHAPGQHFSSSNSVLCKGVKCASIYGQSVLSLPILVPQGQGY